jgi:hypothetical protein
LISVLNTLTRTAVANEYKLDKEQTSYHDLLDAFRLSLQLYRGVTNNEIQQKAPESGGFQMKKL